MNWKFTFRAFSRRFYPKRLAESKATYDEKKWFIDLFVNNKVRKWWNILKCNLKPRKLIRILCLNSVSSRTYDSLYSVCLCVCEPSFVSTHPTAFTAAPKLAQKSSHSFLFQMYSMISVFKRCNTCLYCCYKILFSYFHWWTQCFLSCFYGA